MSVEGRMPPRDGLPVGASMPDNPFRRRRESAMPDAGASADGPATKLAVALIEAFPEPALLVGMERRVLAANAAATDMLGRGTVGNSVFAVLRQPEAMETLNRVLSNDATAQAEARVEHATASGETTYRLVVRRLSPKTGLDAALVTFIDISHIEEAEQMRRDFVANVSHELRSPLTVLSGFIETLRGAARNDPEARERFLEIMEQEAQRMNRLVDDLLSLSRVEVNERVRPRHELELGQVLRATFAALRPQIEDNGITLAFDEGAGGHRITGDPDQLTQVFHNLVENAIKYGGAGGRIGVTVRRHDRMLGFSTAVLSVEVTDSGEGIDPVHIPRLTERFYRVDTHRSREMGGTGLGLAIVKHIVNRHRGRLVIRSTPGEGSVFTVLLPVFC
jgi:two-component system phosphate regulon sensor histidine kinase PhoR